VTTEICVHALEFRLRTKTNTIVQHVPHKAHSELKPYKLVIHVQQNVKQEVIRIMSKLDNHIELVCGLVGQNGERYVHAVRRHSGRGVPQFLVLYRLVLVGYSSFSSATAQPSCALHRIYNTMNHLEPRRIHKIIFSLRFDDVFSIHVEWKSKKTYKFELHIVSRYTLFW